MTLRADQSSAGRLFLRGFPASLGIIVGVVISMAMVTVVGLGFVLFGMLATTQMRDHFRLAFRIRPRSSWVPGVTATVLAPLSLAVAGGWVSAVQGWLHYGYRFDMHASLLTLPLIYVVAAWIAAPLLFLAVLSIDPRSPRSLRERLPLAMRITSEVPLGNRIKAIVISGVFLLGPVVAAVSFPQGLIRSFSILATIVALVAFLPVASALLVSAYAKAKDAPSEDHHRPLRFPTGLVFLLLTAIALTTYTLVDTSPLESWPLAYFVAWTGFLIALSRQIRAHRLRSLDRFREDAAPTKCAVEGTLVIHDDHATVETSAGSFHVPRNAPTWGALEPRAQVTLVGTFGGNLGGFRDSAKHPWPDDGVLYAGTVNSVIKQHVDRASAFIYGSLLIVCAIAGAMIALS
ncbi:MAG: hypothetical protein AAGE52_08090 [Myxococcota bacterium]